MKKPKDLLTPEDIQELETCMLESNQTSIQILLCDDPYHIRVRVETADDKSGNRVLAVLKVIERVLEKNPTLKIVTVPDIMVNARNRNYSRAYLKFKKKPFWRRLFSRKK